MKNFFSKVFNGLKKAFGAAKTFYVRAGLGKFLDAHVADAVVIITKLAQVNNNAEFKEWQDQAFAEVNQLTGEVKGTWIAILINVAYELVKAQGAKEVEKL